MKILDALMGEGEHSAIWGQPDYRDLTTRTEISAELSDRIAEAIREYRRLVQSQPSSAPIAARIPCGEKRA